ncbi:fatty acid desaturase [Silvibacterium bohemicum]|uniref:Fatty acid desaturase n=1 Tax=Silvibacterium bohemicum TaxID=1577686 RepID=A0A841JPD3_9BACT|nr:fatty acid desaturase [Silvibacterium bohemicum]
MSRIAKYITAGHSNIRITDLSPSQLPRQLNSNRALSLCIGVIFLLGATGVGPVRAPYIDSIYRWVLLCKIVFLVGCLLNIQS